MNNKKKNKLIKRIMTLIVTLLMVALGIVPGGTIKASANHFTESSMYPVQLLNPYEVSVTYNLPPGTVIVMYPNSNSTVYTFLWAENMLKNNSVKNIVMAGVGSSSYGTAAMAKQMANKLGEPVAGIVTGMGDSTIWYYGPEGYYIGRPNNIDGTYYINPASEKLHSLYLGGARPTRLIGHSKGSLDIANGLFKLSNENNSSIYSDATFISLGIGVNYPAGINKYKGYIGTEDKLGNLNTTTYDGATMIEGSSHHINTLYSNYLPITTEMLAR